MLQSLYEGDRPQLVYCCPSCTRVLRVRRPLEPATEAAGLPSGGCAWCGRAIDDIDHRVTPSPSGWSDSHVGSAQARRRTHTPFQAASMPHFHLGFPKLDTLLRPLSVGKLVVLGGDMSSTVAELAVLRAQLPVESGGLDSTIMYIDGGNRSDPYLLSSFARQKAIEPESAMRRVTLHRAFTLHQMASLVSAHLSRAVKDYGTRLVVIADVLGTFNEPELEEREARRALAAMAEGVNDTKKHALVIATLPSPHKYNDTISAWGDAAMYLSSDGGDVRAELVKRKGKEPQTATFKRGRLLRAAKAEARR